ncbi:hypothetical protein [Bacillus sp. RS11]
MDAPKPKVTAAEIVSAFLS